VRREWGPDDTKDIKYAKKDITVVKELHRKTMDNKEEDREMPLIQRCKKNTNEKDFTHQNRDRGPSEQWSGFLLLLWSLQRTRQGFSLFDLKCENYQQIKYTGDKISTFTPYQLPVYIYREHFQAINAKTILTIILNVTLNAANRVRSTFINLYGILPRLHNKY